MLVRGSACSRSYPDSDPDHSRNSNSSSQLSQMRGNPELGFGGTSATMIAVNTPSQELAPTNIAYCSAGDLRMFATPGASSALVLVGDSVVLSPFKHSDIPDGQIALNAIQRRHTKVSSGDQISVITFFPPSGFSLALLTLELDYVKAKANRNEEVMTVRQRVLFEFLGNNYIFTVNQALAEDQEKSISIERGIITDDTYIVFETVSSSGIKELGIGLSEEFAKIFRRAFASPVYPPHVTKKLGIKYVKGMLLYGPPGTGKTLLPRQIGKLLNGREPKY